MGLINNYQRMSSGLADKNASIAACLVIGRSTRRDEESVTGLSLPVVYDPSPIFRHARMHLSGIHWIPARNMRE